MERIDKDLAFMLQFENIAWYEEGIVKILDRRVYPNKINFVECKTHKEVSKAIADMVTQSAGSIVSGNYASWSCGHDRHTEGLSPMCSWLQSIHSYVHHSSHGFALKSFSSSLLKRRDLLILSLF